jgi:CRISPR type I-E-associated protein CasB/Cse2
MDDVNDYPIDQFLRKVASAAAKDDRGYLAELRRGLSKSTQEQAWEHLIPFCEKFEDSSKRAIWCVIGGLAALLVPNRLDSTDPRSNLGATMRTLAKGNGEGDEAKALKSFEPKFRRALSCGETLSLCEFVVSIGRTAAMKGVPMNLKGLFWDLWNWDDPDKRDAIRLRWARQYFRVVEPKSNVPSSSGENPL